MPNLRHFVLIWFCFLPFKSICNLTPAPQGWRLAPLGLNESYTVKHLSMHFARVFLCIAVKSSTFPTFIEAQWPVSYLPMRTLIFPHPSIHANGLHDDCTRLQQAYWSQVDSLSRLWVMDIGWQNANGSEMCPPKLLVFDLIRNNLEVMRIDCGSHIQQNQTDGLVIKMGPKFHCCDNERHIFFILPNHAHILAYDILEQTWLRKELICDKYKTLKQMFPIKPVDFTFGINNALIICDEDGTLYSTRGALILEEHKSNSVVAPAVNKSVQLCSIGSLLGPSRGMMMDELGALFYAVPKFGTVVRCAQITNLTTDANEVIYMTSKNIQQIFPGTEGSVWVLTDREFQPQDLCFPGLL